MITALIQKWADVVLHPSKFFGKEKPPKNLAYGAESVLFSGAISAVIVVLLSAASPASAELTAIFGPDAAFGAAVLTLVLLPLVSVAAWLVVSGVLYAFAKILQGRGTFVPHAHMLAMVSSAFGALSTIISAVIAAAASAGSVAQTGAGILITLYNLYVITIALRGVHKYSTGRAVLTWLAPVVIAVAVLLILGMAVTTLFLTGAITA